MLDFRYLARAILQAILAAQTARLRITLNSDEPDAALAIIEKGSPVADADWQRLFQTEGYIRLKQREASLKRAFTDSSFQTFLKSPDMRGQAPLLRSTLEKWKRASLEQAAVLAFAYLPRNATIHATVYPVIKPIKNSFVFEIKTNPAIFLYLDPSRSQAEFTNTVAHELHHIGFGTACPPPEVQAKLDRLPALIRSLHSWIGAYGEGFAMLAAAGGPAADPQPANPTEWNQELENFNQELSSQNEFFQQILEGKITDSDAIDEKMSTYFGNQGLWYAVGWKMAVTIEQVLGRDRLIQAMCAQDSLLATYNEAASIRNRNFAGKLALWSPELAAGLSVAR